MSEVNIKADESQSANFFSKLMTQNIAETKKEEIQEEIKKEIQEEVKEETLKENAEFLQKTNTTPKSLSNNKMQLRIDEMQQEIERYKYIQKEQEMKLNLFKKTISTLQIQLQEKSSHISRLENEKKGTNNNTLALDNEVVNNLTIQLKEKTDVIVSLEKQIETIQNELEQIKGNLDLHLNDKQTISNKYLEIRQLHQLLDNDCQRQKEELNLKIEMLSISENKLQLEQNLKTNLQKELDLLKSQTSDYMKDIKNITFEKDNEILSLIEKIKTLEENNQKDIEIKKVINKIPESLTLGRARGINTNLKRGMYPTSGPGFRPI